MDQKLQELDEAVLRLKGLALEESTQRSYATHRARYLQFCDEYGLSPVPISQVQAARYVAYLADSLSPSSIPKYLNIIRIIHLEHNLPDPCVLQLYDVKCVLAGLSKEKGTAPRRMEPITPQILLKMLQHIDLTTIDDLSVWAACLLGFFGLLRRSNLFPPSLFGFKADKHLARQAVQWNDRQVTVSLKWTKTIQCKERILSILLVAVPGHPLCPVSALNQLMTCTTDVPLAAPVFWRRGKSGLMPITYK